MFDFFTESVGAGGGNGVNAGVFIPLADLPGMAGGELSTTGTTQEGHAIYSLLNALYSGLALIPSLGIVGINKTSPSGTGTDRYTEGIGLSMQYALDLSSRSFAPIPLPTIGSELGIGAVYLSDIWANCEIVATEGAISGAGLLIPNSLIADYGAGALAGTGEDCRGWIGALMSGLISTVSVRSATVESAIVTRTNPQSSRFTGVSIPAAWYDAANPTTGINGADLGKIRIIQETFLIEYELQSDPESQTLEISVRSS